MWEVAADIQDLRPGERLSARDHEERDAQPVRLADNASQIVRAQAVRSVPSDGLRVASLASEVAFVGDGGRLVGNASRFSGPFFPSWPTSWRRPWTYRQRGVSSLQRLFRGHYPELLSRYDAEFATRLRVSLIRDNPLDSLSG